jgi:hypothetical protein
MSSKKPIGFTDTFHRKESRPDAENPEDARSGNAGPELRALPASDYLGGGTSPSFSTTR